MFREILLIFAAAFTVTVIMGSAPTASSTSAPEKALQEDTQLSPLPMYNFPQALPEYSSAPATPRPSNCWNQEPAKPSGSESLSVNHNFTINRVSTVGRSAGFSL